MSKELLNKIDLSSDEFHNFMDTEVKEAWIESYNSTLSGWHFDIYFNGEYHISGPLSTGSYLGGEYLYLAEIKLGKELPDVVDFNNVESLEDFEAFKEFVLEQEYDVIDLFDLSQEEKDQKFYDLTFLDSYYCEFNREKYSKLLQECIEEYWGDYGYYNVIDSIEMRLDMYKNCDE